MPVIIFLICSVLSSIPLDTILEIGRAQDTEYDGQPRIEIELYTYHNFYNSVTVGFDLTNYGQTVEIQGAELILGNDRDSTCILRTISPFSYKSENKGDSSNKITTRILLKFPWTSHVGGINDELKLFTDKGVIHLYLNEERRTAEKLDTQQRLFDITRNTLNNDNKSLRIWLFIALLCIIVIISGSALLMRTRKKLNNNEINRLKMLLSENDAINKDLKERVDQLYNNRFETLNILCNEYFEKGTNEKLRLSIINEIEKEILKLRNPKTIEDLEEAVNRYKNNIMLLAREELSFLRRDDIVLLTYLYSGLSSRAICILTDIKIKNFYVRRQRLKSKIESSGALHTDLFIKQM